MALNILFPWLLACFVALAAACSKGEPTANPSEQTGAHGGQGDGTGEHKAEARIYAATSLTDVIDAIGKQFEPMRGSHLVPSYGASNTLAQQIHDGAPPGVFLSASVEWVDKLEGWGMVEPGSRVEITGNSLVVIVPKDAKNRPATLADLTAAEYPRLALADPVAVPAGKYAKAALEKAGVFEQVKAKVVAAQDVRMALAYVERGEALVGIVYATDAAASTKVDVAFRIAPDLHPRIVYPMVLVNGANRRAHELHAFLQSPEAWTVFERAGFTKPAAPAGAQSPPR